MKVIILVFYVALGLSLVRCSGRSFEGSITFVLGFDQSGLTNLSPQDKSDVMGRTLEVITNRLSQFGVSDLRTEPMGDNLKISLSGANHEARYRRLITGRGRLEFRAVISSERRDVVLNTTEAYRPLKNYLRKHNEELVMKDEDLALVRMLIENPKVKESPDAVYAFRWGWGNKVIEGKNYKTLYILDPRIAMTGELFGRVTADDGVITLTATGDSKRAVSLITGAHVGERLAVLLDDSVLTVIALKAKIRDGKISIPVDLDIVEAEDTAIMLNSGALPIRIRIE